MINCLVLDDEQYSIDVLVHHIKQTPFLHLVNTTTQPAEALKILGEETVQLLFCDIQMPNVSGLDIIKAIKGRCKVILTTAYSQYALDGYELDVTDYLLKPISYPRFLAAAQKVNTAINAQPLAGTAGKEDDYVFVKTGVKGKVQRINLSEIDYIEGVKNYVSIHHGGKSTLVSTGMKDLEMQLPVSQFIRVHKSFIIPLSRITGLEGNKILLQNVKAEIILGDTYRLPFLALIHHKIIGR